MKAPELNELISESYPKNNDDLIEQLKNKIYELEQENIFYKQENYNLEEEINNSKKIDYENKSKLTLLMTQINNLRQENDKISTSFQEMQILNQKLVEDNKILMSELDKKNIKKEEESMIDIAKDQLEEKNKIIIKLNSELTSHEEYIKKLFEDNKQLNEANKNIIKETEEKIKELNDNIKLLNEEINLRDDKIGKLEEEIYRINTVVEEANKYNINLNNINSSLEEKNKELIDNLNNHKNSIITLEQKHNSVLIELEKKEKIINDFQEKFKYQAKQISNLIINYNTLIGNNKDSLLLMNKIKTNHFDLYNKYEYTQNKLEEIKKSFNDDNSLEKFLIEIKGELITKRNNNIKDNENENNECEKNNMNESGLNNLAKKDDNQNNETSKEYSNYRNYIYDTRGNERMTMDQKYDFLFDNKNK